MLSAESAETVLFIVYLLAIFMAFSFAILALVKGSTVTKILGMILACSTVVPWYILYIIC